MLLSRYLVGGVVAVAFVVGVWLHGNSKGRESCQKAASRAANEIAQSYADQADKLREGAVQREQETRVVIREVYREKDPTGCADTAAPEWMLDALRPSAD